MTVVYLIHFDSPLGDPRNARGQAQHYIGSADDLAQRIQEHRENHGAAILRACNQQQIGWQVVRVWQAERSMERKLKAHKRAADFCPVCRMEVCHD